MGHSLHIEGKADVGIAKQMNICKKKKTIFKKRCYAKLVSLSKYIYIASWSCFQKSKWDFVIQWHFRICHILKSWRSQWWMRKGMESWDCDSEQVSDQDFWSWIRIHMGKLGLFLQVIHISKVTQRGKKMSLVIQHVFWKCVYYRQNNHEHHIVWGQQQVDFMWKLY